MIERQGDASAARRCNCNAPSEASAYRRSAPELLGVDAKMEDRDEQKIELLSIAGMRVGRILAGPLHCLPAAGLPRRIFCRRVDRELLADELREASGGSRRAVSTFGRRREAREFGTTHGTELFQLAERAESMVSSSASLLAQRCTPKTDLIPRGTVSDEERRPSPEPAHVLRLRPPSVADAPSRPLVGPRMLDVRLAVAYAVRMPQATHQLRALAAICERMVAVELGDVGFHRQVAERVVGVAEGAALWVVAAWRGRMPRARDVRA